ncbi:inositol-1-monophosphatase [Telmatospirillum siberiense]|uniref:Inositol-1-monophosphatase n=1 Tax=Telmatospirillum siberiense TaxID=382514 RepID=A0A2N3PZ82_9PROT|nr:inositol-1-monophosphatase [Telmatospirillum siberiense]
MDPLRVATILGEISAEVILPRFQKLASGDVREKGPGDLVTIADTEAEAVLTRRLGALLPSSRVVGEEAVSADAKVLGHLDGEDPVWILDPVDGTANFVKGSKRFAVIVALVVAGRTMQGWIHDPMAGRTTIAEQGGGVWRDGRRLGIAAAGALAGMTGAAGYRGTARLAAEVGGLLCQGSAAHDYLDLVDNKLQFAYFRRLHPWDHAAGVLLHAEAGGYNALLDGQAYRPVPTPGSILLAPDRPSWDRLAQLIGA